MSANVMGPKSTGGSKDRHKMSKKILLTRQVSLFLMSTVAYIFSKYEK